MARVFDASSYFTRRQSDLRYVKGPLTAQTIRDAISGEPGSGWLPGGVLVPGTVSQQEIANEAVSLRHMLGTDRPPRIVQSSPALPDPLFPPDSMISLGGKLYRNDNNVAWVPVVRAADLEGELSEDNLNASIIQTALYAQKIVAPKIVQGLPTVEGNPPNYKPGDLVLLEQTGKLYRLLDSGVWDPVVKMSQFDPGAITAELALLAADSVIAGTVAAGAIGSREVATESLLAENIASDSIIARHVKAGEIKTNHMLAGTINADRLIANSIVAGLLAAGAVSTDKLIVGSFDNLLEDPNFDKLPAVGCWSPDGQGLQVWTDPGHSKDGIGYAAVKAHGSQFPGWPSTATSTLYNRYIFEVSAGQKLYSSVWVQCFGSTGQATIGVVYFSGKTADGAGSGLVGAFPIASVNPAGAASWTEISGTHTAPANAHFAQVYLQVTGQSTGLWRFDQAYCRKKIVSAYIEELDAGLIRTGELDASLIRVKNLNAAEINVGVLNVERISQNSLSIQDMVIDSDVDVSAYYGAGQTGVRLHGAAGPTASMTMVYAGVTYHPVYVHINQKYAYLTVNPGLAPGTSTATVLSQSNTMLDPFDVLGNRNVLVATLERYQDASGNMHVTAHSADNASSYIGKRVDIVRGDTRVVVAGEYDHTIDGYIGLRVIKNDDASARQARMTYEYLDFTSSGTTRAAIGYRDFDTAARPFLVIGSENDPDLSVNLFNWSGVTKIKKLQLTTTLFSPIQFSSKAFNGTFEIYDSGGTRVGFVPFFTS